MRIYWLENPFCTFPVIFSHFLFPNTFNKQENYVKDSDVAVNVCYNCVFERKGKEKNLFCESILLMTVDGTMILQICEMSLRLF